MRRDRLRYVLLALTAVLGIVLLGVLALLVIKMIGTPLQEQTETAQTQQETFAELVSEEIESKSMLQTAAATEPQTSTERQTEARDLLADMSTEEKVAQLFVITPEALVGYDEVTMAGEVTQQAYDAMPVGGIILMEPNLVFPEQLQEMTANLHSYSEQRIGVSVLIAIDEEGGSVARLANHGSFPVSYVGDMADIGASGDPALAYQTGETLGRYLSGYGIDVDYAPVADVYWNSENTVVSRRSFGSDADMVAQMVAEEVRALQASGVSATLKHFPGHGGTSGDSHEGFVSIWGTMEELQARDLVPFQTGIDAGADLVMVGHICTPEITGDEVPATLSYYWVTEILREQMGFEGVVITDALNMGAISQYYSSGEACIQAVQAGVDMLLMPADFQGAYQSVLEAVRDGRIPQERLDESVRRIMRLKDKKAGTENSGGR